MSATVLRVAVGYEDKQKAVSSTERSQIRRVDRQAGGELSGDLQAPCVLDTCENSGHNS